MENDNEAKKATKQEYNDLEELVLFGVMLASAIDEATRDGLSINDIFKFVVPLTKLPAAIDGIDNVPKKLSDLTEEDRVKLVQLIKDLEFVDDKAEVIAEQALRCAVEICNLIMKIRETK